MKHIKRLSFILAILMIFSLVAPLGNIASNSSTQNDSASVDVYYLHDYVGESINYSFYLKNNSSSTIDLSEVTVRYWYTRGQPRREQFAKYSTIDENNHLQPMFITVSEYEDADTVFELSFENYKDHYIEPGEKSFKVEVKIWEEGGDLSQYNNYSFVNIDNSKNIDNSTDIDNSTNIDNSTDNYVHNPNITIYTNNYYIGGEEPGFNTGDDTAAIIFDDKNFNGSSVSLKQGLYSTKLLEKLGFDDNDISSILVKNGYRITLFEENYFNYYNPDASKLALIANNSNLSTNNFNNITSSIIVEKIGDEIEIPKPPIVIDDGDDEDEDDKDDEDKDDPKLPGGIVIDTNVSISTDQMKYTEGQIITYTIDYANIYNIETGPMVIEAQIPEYTKIFDETTGIVEEDTIRWEFDKFEPKETGKLQYKVEVDELDVPEVMSLNTTRIKPVEDILEKPENAESTIAVLLFSSQNNTGRHSQYIIGYPDGKFKPSNNITRAEIATVFARISGVNNPNKTGELFPDVDENHWASGFIAVATKDLNLFSGYPDGTFKPDTPITRAELATLTAKYLEINATEPIEDKFEDSKHHWARNFIGEAYRYQIISGYPDGTFKPDSHLTRAESVTMVNNMTYRGPLVTSTQTFPDVYSSHWAFGNIESATRSYEFLRTANGNEVLKSETFLYTINDVGLAVLR